MKLEYLEVDNCRVYQGSDETNLAILGKTSVRESLGTHTSRIEHSPPQSSFYLSKSKWRLALQRTCRLKRRSKVAGSPWFRRTGSPVSQSNSRLPAWLRGSEVI